MEILTHIAGLAFIPFFFLAISWGIRDIFRGLPVHISFRNLSTQATALMPGFFFRPFHTVGG
ncbi:hypothetical protein [Emcibacter nanhaiensis]|uniref:Uncharacterized protein n=1 Tax=Emcibacter nanhaiensis TaxID=1505037 RepID=A0A501PSQ0_9PROT|nr:hypothetical protein [Emcibacter nanhaiensis]TPD63082.1 hypothetical protein FIV46_03095 [Emcibacter nanhaiensis]